MNIFTRLYRSPQVVWYRVGVLLFTPPLLNVFFDFMDKDTSAAFAWAAYLVLVATLFLDWYRVARKRRMARKAIDKIVKNTEKDSGSENRSAQSQREADSGSGA